MVKITNLIEKMRGQPKDAVQGQPRLHFETQPAAIYAIGDIHGCLDQLLRLESLIIADGQAIEGEKWLISLGDLVDRGPQSAAVLDHMISDPPTGFRRFCLMGNHEAMMLEFLSAPTMDHPWLVFGGMETMASYGIHDPAPKAKLLKMQLDSHIPDEHVQFMRQLPVMITVGALCFVHAGIRPGVALEEQTDRDLMWLRPEKPGAADAGSNGPLVVHGHTPVEKLEVVGNRLDLDTGAFATGKLSAARFSADGSIVFIQCV